MGDITTSMRISINDGLIEISGSEKFVADQLSNHDNIFDIYNEMWKLQEALANIEDVKNNVDSVREQIKMALERIKEAQERVERMARKIPS